MMPIYTRNERLKKYLQGELDVNTLIDMLKAVDHEDKPHRQPLDVAYG